MGIELDRSIPADHIVPHIGYVEIRTPGGISQMRISGEDPNYVYVHQNFVPDPKAKNLDSMGASSWTKGSAPNEVIPGQFRVPKEHTQNMWKLEGK